MRKSHKSRNMLQDEKILANIRFDIERDPYSKRVSNLRNGAMLDALGNLYLALYERPRTVNVQRNVSMTSYFL